MDVISEIELAKVLNDNRKMMYRKAYSILGNHADAEDAVQEASIRALLAISGLKKRESIKSWLLAITANAAKNIIRSNKRLLPDGVVLEERCKSESAEDLTVEKIDVCRAINGLDFPYYETIKAFYYEGQSIKQIAREQNVSVGTVKSRLARGRRLIAAALGSGVLTVIVVFGMTERPENIPYDDSAAVFEIESDDAFYNTEAFYHIRFIDSEEEITDDGIYYIRLTRSLYLPGRQLSDDELSEVERLRATEGDITEILYNSKSESDTENKSKGEDISYETYDLTVPSPEDIYEATGINEAVTPEVIYDNEAEKVADEMTEAERYYYYCSDTVPTDERMALEEQPAEWIAWKEEVEREREQARIEWEQKTNRGEYAFSEELQDSNEFSEHDEAAETDASDTTAASDDTTATEQKDGLRIIGTEKITLSPETVERLKIRLSELNEKEVEENGTDTNLLKATEAINITEATECPVKQIQGGNENECDND